MPYHRDNRTGGNSGKKYGKKVLEEDLEVRDSARPVMHQAICSECDKECEVPFKPSGDKPVFAGVVLKIKKIRDRENQVDETLAKRILESEVFPKRHLSKVPAV